MTTQPHHAENRRPVIGLDTSPATLTRHTDSVRDLLTRRGVDLPVVPATVVTALPHGRIGQTTTSRLIASREPDIMIAITAGHGPDRFRAVYAHELTHALFALHATGPIPPLVEEGVCELVSLIWMRAAGVPDILIQLAWNNPDPIYGAGLRCAANSSRRHGIRTVLYSVITRNQLP